MKELIKLSEFKVVYSAIDIAKMLNIGRNSAYKLITSEEFPSFRIGKKIIVTKVAFENCIGSKSSSNKISK